MSQRIADRKGKLVGEDVIAEALNEESGETSSLVESIFTVSFSKMNETPFKDHNIASQNRQQQLPTKPDSPAVSRHVKFLDEDEILNADELASINKDEDGPTDGEQMTTLNSKDDSVGQGLVQEG